MIQPVATTRPNPAINLAFAGRPTHHTAEKRTLLYSDLDESYLHWRGGYNFDPDTDTLAQNQQVLGEFRDHLYPVISTSRGLTEMKRVAPYLKGVSLYGIGLNNGLEWFHNNNPNLTADQWIPQLTMADADKTWQRKIRQRARNFELPTVMRVIEHTLSSAHEKQGETIRFEKDAPMPAPLDTLVNYVATINTEAGPRELTVSFYPDQPSFALRSGSVRYGHAQGSDKPFEPPTEEHLAWGAYLSDAIETQLSELDITIKTMNFPYNGPQQLYLFSPDADSRSINKDALLEHIIDDINAKRSRKGFEPLKAEITVGDQKNDTMLGPDAHRGLTNHRILVGDHESLNPFREKAHVYEEPRAGRLGPGLRQHMLDITG